MGSRSSSSTASTNITKDLTTNNVDNRVSGGGDIGGNININVADVSGESPVTVNTSDFGAIKSAERIATLSIGEVSDISEFALDKTVSALNKATTAAVDVAKSATQDEGARTQQFLILGFTVSLVGYFLINRIRAK